MSLLSTNLQKVSYYFLMYITYLYVPLKFIVFIPVSKFMERYISPAPPVSLFILPEFVSLIKMFQIFGIKHRYYTVKEMPVFLTFLTNFIWLSNFVFVLCMIEATIEYYSYYQS